MPTRAPGAFGRGGVGMRPNAPRLRAGWANRAAPESAAGQRSRLEARNATRPLLI
jgi:hypothetical protein